MFLQRKYEETRIKFEFIAIEIDRETRLQWYAIRAVVLNDNTLQQTEN